ncbi:hypothetical protein [Sporosarcina trichiuri]|nr:hypothetical protein [Sporosarcina sp. 0.2-SM1T-5]WJY28096.1 hypothetical protein QWT68_03690 [Sporosarcina sp. 0.2-SM1T-5]
MKNLFRSKWVERLFFLICGLLILWLLSGFVFILFLALDELS